jgi:hypothetical protein
MQRSGPMSDESRKYGGRACWIGKNGIPLTKAEGTGNDQGNLLIQGASELKEELAPSEISGDKAKVSSRMNGWITSALPVLQATPGGRVRRPRSPFASLPGPGRPPQSG